MSFSYLTDADRERLPAPVQAILEALRADLSVRFRMLAVEPVSPQIAQYILDVYGINETTAATVMRGDPDLAWRVIAPNDDDLLCAHWFGPVGRAIVQLEVPLVALDPSRLCISVSENEEVLFAWAQSARAALACDLVDRLVRPIISQANEFGTEAIAAGFAQAAKQLPLLAAIATTAQRAWIATWTESLAQRAPTLAQIHADFVASVEPSGAATQRPSRLMLESREGDGMWVSAKAAHRFLTRNSALLKELRHIAGPQDLSGEAAVALVSELMALVSVHYWFTGSASMALARPAAPDEPSSEDCP